MRGDRIQTKMSSEWGMAISPKRRSAGPPLTLDVSEGGGATFTLQWASAHLVFRSAGPCRTVRRRRGCERCSAHISKTARCGRAPAWARRHVDVIVHHHPTMQYILLASSTGDS